MASLAEITLANNVTEHVTERKHGGLSKLPATAICGNDITSSCLYVSALAIITP